jgi:DNA repair exonuclease SbcCD ATPase subunit
VTYDVLDELKKEQEHQQFLLKLLTDKNSFIRRRIINRTIPFLNARLIHYTKQLGLPHVVKFDDDMSCTVSEFGRELDFGNLSSGEKKRVNLSLSLAFRDVLHHLHSKVNCLFIDEIDASLDGAGVEAVFKLLKQKTRDDGLGLWIISHRPEAIGRFDRQIIVRKQNGFSSIVDHDAQIDEVEEALT